MLINLLVFCLHVSIFRIINTTKDVPALLQIAWQLVCIEQPHRFNIALVTSVIVFACNRPISQIPQCITQISHNNAPFCKRNVHMCAHFCYKMLHCGIWHRCILEFVKWVYYKCVVSGTTNVGSGYGFSQWETTLQCNVVSLAEPVQWRCTV